MINTLFDTNAVLRYYFPAQDTYQTVNYLLKNNKKLINNITGVQIVEVLSTFYNLRNQNILESDEELDGYKETFLNDIKEGVFTMYDFAREHIKDFDVYKSISEVSPPPDGGRVEYLKQSSGFAKIFRNAANTCDNIMLLIMREIHLLTDKKCYLITSDAHVKLVAEALGIKIVDPGLTPIRCLPPDLDRREDKREDICVSVVCRRAEEPSFVLSTSTLDISRGGACIKSQDRTFELGTILSMDMSEIADKRKRLIQDAEVVRVERERIGVKFLEPLSIIDFFKKIW